MKKEILNNLSDFKLLEKQYQENKTEFKKSFNEVFDEIKDNPIAQVWHQRLNYETESISWGTNRELMLVIGLGLVAGIIAKIPKFTGLKEDFFYPRNLVFVVFPVLILYFIWKKKVETKKLIYVLALVLFSVVYINFLPNKPESNTLILACIHLPLFLWAMLGYSYTANNPRDYNLRLSFLRFNGDMVVMGAIILLSGMVMTGITIGLFSLININIEVFYFDYVGIFGLSAAPLVAVYLVQTNPHLVNKVSPIIAKIFTPLVLVMLICYLVAIIYSGKDPYNDREFLLLFNLLLIGVMALILFSVAETSNNSGSKIGVIMLFGLSVVTIIINSIALSAIIFRISTMGFTPNRTAVLGSNVLILINLLIVSFRLFKVLKDKNDLIEVEKSITYFLPIYSVWTLIVTFLFPIFFGFR